MAKKPRITSNVTAILAVMLADFGRAWYGLELAKEAEIGSATVYAALARLERAGWVKGSWEAIDPQVAGRPQRRLYSLTAEGGREAREAVDAQRARLGMIFRSQSEGGAA
jgi:PadR family transcriptional regulator PadR